MQVVIDIPEDAYRQIRNWGVPTDELRRKIYDIIDNGTPLPEHHGDLIDRQRLQREMEKDKRKAMSFVDLTDFVWLAPTIIEGSD